MEDVSPVPLHDGSIGGYIREYFDVIVAEINALLGLGRGGASAS